MKKLVATLGIAASLFAGAQVSVASADTVQVSASRGCTNC